MANNLMTLIFTTIVFDVRCGTNYSRNALMQPLWCIDEQSRPFDLQQLQDLASQGAIKPSTLIRPLGRGSWIRADELSGLMFSAPGVTMDASHRDSAWSSLKAVWSKNSWLILAVVLVTGVFHAVVFRWAWALLGLSAAIPATLAMGKALRGRSADEPNRDDVGDASTLERLLRGTAVAFLVLTVVSGIGSLLAGISRSAAKHIREYNARHDSSEDDLRIAILVVGRERLTSRLKDPDSLQIIEEKVVRPGRYGGKAGYWARYRAKNSFGGYEVDEFYSE